MSNLIHTFTSHKEAVKAAGLNVRAVEERNSAYRWKNICKDCKTIRWGGIDRLTKFQCPGCKQYSKSPDLFLEQLYNKHKDKIIALDPYVNAKTLLRFKCDSGHIFNGTPRYVIKTNSSTRGCPKCKGLEASKLFSLGIDEYRSRVLKKYKDITCVDGNYTNRRSLITHECNKGHTIRCTAGSMLSRSRFGCPMCHPPGNSSKSSIDFLSRLSRKTKLRFMHAGKGREFTTELGYRLDGYNKTFNIAVEFHGDYFHGGRKGKGNMQKYLKTVWREKELRDAGYHLLVVWYSQYVANPDDCLRRVARKIEDIKFQQQLHRQ